MLTRAGHLAMGPPEADPNFLCQLVHVVAGEVVTPADAPENAGEVRQHALQGGRQGVGGGLHSRQAYGQRAGRANGRRATVASGSPTTVNAAQSAGVAPSRRVSSLADRRASTTGIPRASPA